MFGQRGIANFSDPSFLVGSVSLNGAVKVNRNTAGFGGGGIFNDAGAFLSGATAGVNVRFNEPDDIAP